MSKKKKKLKAEESSDFIQERPIIKTMYCPICKDRRAICYVYSAEQGIISYMLSCHHIVADSKA